METITGCSRLYSYVSGETIKIIVFRFPYSFSQQALFPEALKCDFTR